MSDLDNSKVIDRYTEESSSTCNLSCGNNLNFLQIKPGESILDLGCGRGEETIMASQLLNYSGIAIGLDITPAMIDIAIANAKAKDIPNVKFVLGEIENLPFDSNIFDAVMSNCVINHAKSKESVYNEIYRVLKLGGRFVISDAVTKLPLPKEIKEDPEQISGCFGGAVTEKEYLSSITNSGFKNVEILKRREYVKNGYDFISITIKAIKQ